MFVIDGSLEPGIRGGFLEEPIVLTYKDGRIVSVYGGLKASEFEAWLHSCDDEIWGFSHIGGGFNRMAGLTGNLMEDERILGSFCVAGGANNLRWSGSNCSKFHFDGIILRASYFVDDIPVCEEGRFVHPHLLEAASKNQDDLR